MANSTYHVVPNAKGGWSVKKRGSERATRTFDNKESAQKFGVQISNKNHSDLVVHKKDGTIQSRKTASVKATKTPMAKKR